MNKYFGFLHADGYWLYFKTTYEEKTDSETYHVYGRQIYPDRSEEEKKFYIRSFFDDEQLFKNEYCLLINIFKKN